MAGKPVVRTGRLEWKEGRRVVVVWNFRSVVGGVEIEQVSLMEFDGKRCAANLLQVVSCLLDDYLREEAEALLSLVANEIADEEWEAAHREDDLPF